MRAWVHVCVLIYAECFMKEYFLLLPVIGRLCDGENVGLRNHISGIEIDSCAVFD